MAECQRTFVCANRPGIFALTFTSYVCFHATRKSFSNIKSTLVNSAFLHNVAGAHSTPTELLGLLDTLFLFCYAFGLYASGMVADRLDPRRVLVVAQVLVGLVMVAFATGGHYNEHSIVFYATLWALNGGLQSLGFPTNVGIMGNWYGKGERGALMGIWMGNACCGNIVGAALVVLVQVLVVGSASGGVATSEQKHKSWVIAIAAAGIASHRI